MSLIIDYLYFADSLGCMDNEYVKKTTENFCADWNGHIGIHAHNNKSMALSNTLESLKHGALFVTQQLWEWVGVLVMPKLNF